MDQAEEKYFIQSSTVFNGVAAVIILAILCAMQKNLKPSISWFKNIWFDHDTKNKEKISGISGVLCYMLSPFIGLFGLTDFFGFPLQSWCRNIYIADLLFYNVGNISLFFAFSYRVESIFVTLKPPKNMLFCGHCSYPNCGGCIFTTYRIIGVAVILVLWIYLIFPIYNDIKPHENGACYPKGSGDATTEIIIGLTNILFTFLTAIYYIFKLCTLSKVSTYASINSDTEEELGVDIRSEMIELSQGESSRMIRHMIPIISIALITSVGFHATVIFVRWFGYFSQIDGVINSLCLYWMFNWCTCCWCCNIDDDDDQDDKLTEMVRSNPTQNEELVNINNRNPLYNE